jgi:copper chaperone CopZ
MVTAYHYPLGVVCRTRGETMATSEYQVTGMTCGHCEVAIRDELGQLPGVEHVDVSAATGALVVRSADLLDDAAVLAAVDEAGYTAERVS